MTTFNHACIDIGNTNVHIGLFDCLNLVDSIKIPTSGFYNECWLLENIPKNLPVVYCSVVPTAKKVLLHKLSTTTTPIELNHTNCGIPISYPKPEEIGADRLANAIAAYDSGTTFSIVVDVGTATTFDIINEQGYCGGVIAPGPQGYLDFLNQNTALLPNISLPKNMLTENVIGKSTSEAMLLGVKLGYNAMVSGIICSISDRIHPKSQPPALLLVGGASDLLTSPTFQYRPFLTLEGLAIASSKIGKT